MVLTFLMSLKCPFKEGNVQVTEDRPAMKEPMHLNLKQLVRSGATEDEDTGLGESLPNTATSSQASLSALPPPSHPPLSCNSSGYSGNSNSNSSSSAAAPNPLTQPLLRVSAFSLCAASAFCLPVSMLS